MKQFTTNSGFGFLKDANNHLITKVDLTPGDHELAEGFTFVELTDRATFETLEVYQDPEDLKLAADKAKIEAAIEQLAIEKIKSDNLVLESEKYKGK